MDWAAFWGAILGGLITAVVSYLVSQNKIKADLKKTEQEINSKFYIEVKAHSIQEWIDKLRDNLASLVTIAYKAPTFGISNYTVKDAPKNFIIINDFQLKKSLIELMLTGNNKEPEEQKLLILLNSLNDAICDFFAHISKPNYMDLYNEDTDMKEVHITLSNKICKFNKEIIETGKIILKQEYDKKNNLITQSP